MQFNSTESADNVKVMQQDGNACGLDSINEKQEVTGGNKPLANISEDKPGLSSSGETTNSRRSSSRSSTTSRDSISRGAFKSSDRRESEKIFRKIDYDNSKGASKGEIYKFVSSNDKLWSMLSKRLDFPERECRKIATRVAMEAATGLQGQEAMDAEINKDQFHSFRKRYMLDKKGMQAFFHRAVFAAFDRDGNGELDSDELDDFLDIIFYQSDAFFEKDNDFMEDLPPKEYLKRAILEKFDDDGNGTLDYEEIRSIITGKAIAEAAEAAAKAAQADEVDKRLKKGGGDEEGDDAKSKDDTKDEETKSGDSVEEEVEEETSQTRSGAHEGARRASTIRSASRERRDEARKAKKKDDQVRKLEELRQQEQMEEELMLASIDAARKATEERLAIERSLKNQRRSWFGRGDGQQKITSSKSAPSLQNMPYTFHYDTRRRISKLWC